PALSARTGPRPTSPRRRGLPCFLDGRRHTPHGSRRAIEIPIPYDSLRLSRTTMGASDTLSVSVSVTNTGARAGDEVVQLYIRDDVARVSRPVRELKGFQRITLRAGDVRRVSFAIAAEQLAFTIPA
ncbi:MAG: fibronectin type III-like domain-contianing protein, partial [Gemmatimonadaceae bacterium]|nr:fibronectin type III-like domain-contianing protein [Gemmatimonadaceae bacterium]